MMSPPHNLMWVPCRGYNIGVRLVDEFLAKAKQGRCSSFREAAEVVAKQALPMFLNVSASVTSWSADGAECSLVRVCTGDCSHSLCTVSKPQTYMLLCCTVRVM